jgi:Cu-Zn family superoxide dismutase
MTELEKEESEMKHAKAIGITAVTALLCWALAANAAGPQVAQATLQSKAGVSVKGTVKFVELGGTTRVAVRLSGVPAGTHGFHLHDKGDCGDPEFANAGGHFNPTAAPHAGPHATPRHAGDLGNVEAGADGTVSIEVESNLLTVAPGPNSVVGRAVVLHEKADDLTTQPTGNAGARIACGVIAASSASGAKP